MKYFGYRSQKDINWSFYTYPLTPSLTPLKPKKYINKKNYKILKYLYNEGAQLR